MNYLIKIAEWIIALVRQQNGVLESELAQVTERYKTLQKDKASLDELFWKTDRAIVEKQIAITSLNKKVQELNDEYDDAVEKGLINITFIKDAVSEMEELVALRKLGGENETEE